MSGSSRSHGPRSPTRHSDVHSYGWRFPIPAKACGADFDPRTSERLGTQVVGLPVKQLKGALTIHRAWAGARFIVTLPLAA